MDVDQNDQLPSDGSNPEMMKINDHDGLYFPIAIVGIGLRMPGAESVDEFEAMLVEERCAIGDFREDRWHHEDHYHHDVHAKGHYVIPKMAWCDRYYDFDAEYFEMSPREATTIDPQQRQVLAMTEEALQDAGYTRRTVPRRTAVYIGMGIMDYPGGLTENRFMYSAHSVVGLAHSCAANRVSNFYGMTGPSAAVDTACAASLTALHSACLELWSGQAEAAIAGASSNMHTAETTIGFSQLGVLSATGNSAPFDVTNDGYVRGEGTGVVLLKPLADAVRDGDHVYCTIRAAWSAHNGNSNSLTLPSAASQSSMIERCYEHFDIPMERITFVEAHGTGTPVGDPIETRALGSTIGRARRLMGKTEPLRIQSSKSNFGHLEVAAGMVQVVKAALMLEKRRFYKQTHWTKPNPRIDLDELNLSVHLKAEPYTSDENFLIGVNTFGFGGSLVHFVFEEYKKQWQSTNGRAVANSELLAGWQFGDGDVRGRKLAVPLSAKVERALRNTIDKWLSWHDEADAQSVVGWLATRREHYRQRRIVVLADSGADFRSKLRSYLTGRQDDDVISGSVSPVYRAPAVCFVYPGWGQQHHRMGRCLYRHSPTFRAAVKECDAIFEKMAGYSALERYGLFTKEEEEEEEGPGEKPMDGLACKPAILFLQVGLTKLLCSWGVKPASVLGFGIGELTAAYAAGVVTLEAAVALMWIRMKTPTKDEFIRESSALLNGTKPTKAQFFSTITGQEHVDGLNATYWWQNITCQQQQKQREAIESVIGRNPEAVFIELSATSCTDDLFPKSFSENVLRCCHRNEDDWSSVLRVMSKLHVAGYPIDWSSVTLGTACYARIPVYGFDERKYLLETPEFTGRRCGLIERTLRNLNGRINMNSFTYLRDNTLGDELLFPAAGYIEYFSEYDDSRPAALREIAIYKNLKLLPLTADGNVQTVKLEMKRTKSALYAVNEDGDVMAKATLDGACGSAGRPAKLDIEGIRSRCPEIIEAADLYRNFERLGLSYGFFFRLVQQIFVGDMEALAVCAAPHSRSRHERIETPMLEAAFQAAIGAFTTGETLYMPRGAGRLRMYVDKVPPTTPYVVKIKLTEYSLEAVVCDLTIASVDGDVWLTVSEFCARSVARFVTDVDYGDCCYATRWQARSSMLPKSADFKTMMASADDVGKAAELGVKLQLLDDLVGSLSSEMLEEVRDVSLADKLKRLGELAPEGRSSQSLCARILDDVPEVSVEMTHLRDIAAELRRDPEGVQSVRDQSVSLLRQSQLVAELIRPCVGSVRMLIQELLRSKVAVRVGDIGGESAVLTKQLAETFRDQIESARLEYLYLGDDRRDFNRISRYLADLPIKYELLSATDLKGGYDVIIVSDLKGRTAGELSELRSLLTGDGAVVVLRPAAFRHVHDFLSLTETTGDAPVDVRLMAESGFVNVTELSSGSRSPFAVVVAQAPPTSPQSDASTCLVVGDDEPNVAEAIRGKLSSRPVAVSRLRDVDAAAAAAAAAVVYLMGSEASVGSTLDVMRFVDEKTDGSVSALHAIYNKDAEREELRGLAAMIRSAGRRSRLPVCTTTAISRHEARELSPVSDVIDGGDHADGELMIVAGRLLAPRIVRLDTRPRPTKDDAWQLSLVSSADGVGRPTVRCRVVALPVHVGEVRIRVRALAVQDWAADVALYAYAGTVEAIGGDVGSFGVGEAVMGLSRMVLGSDVVCRAVDVFPMPGELTWTESANSLLAYCTAHAALLLRAELTAGQTVLVNPAASTVGLAAVHLARYRGAKVVCSYRSGSCCNIAAVGHGLVTLADHERPGFRADVMRFTDEKGIDVILQIGDDFLPDALLEVLSCGGRLITVGKKEVTLSGASMASCSNLNMSKCVTGDEGEFQTIVSLVASLLDAGTVPPIRTNGKHISEAPSLLTPTSGDSGSLETVVLEIPDDYMPPVIHSADFRFRSDAVYVVSGGQNGFVLELCRWLSDHGCRHLALILDPDEKESNFTKATRQRLERDGTRIYRISTLITSPEAVKAAIDEISAISQRVVRGVFHAPDEDNDLDVDLLGVDPDIIEKSFRSRIERVKMLDRGTSAVELDHFVVFSSAHGSWTDHSRPLASAIAVSLAEICERRRAIGKCALCMELGQVRGLGSVSTDAREVASADGRGSLSMHFREYLTILGTLLRMENLPSTVLVTNQNWDEAKKVVPGDTLKFRHLCKENGLSDNSGNVDVMTENIGKCKRFIAELLGGDEAGIDPDHPMTAYGVDSLMSQDIISWAQQTLKVTVEQTEIFAGLSINQLLAKL